MDKVRFERVFKGMIGVIAGLVSLAIAGCDGGRSGDGLNSSSYAMFEEDAGNVETGDTDPETDAGTGLEDCRCEKATVKCLDEPCTLCCNQEDCEICLTKDMCEDLGLDPDAEENEVEPVEGYEPPDSAPPDSQCLMMHEMQHACDEVDNSETGCSTENTAYETTLACYERLWEELGCEQRPADADCVQIFVGIGQSEAGVFFHKCLCDGGNWWSACPACKADCHDEVDENGDPAFTEEDCNEMFSTYCWTEKPDAGIESVDAGTEEGPD